MLFIISLSLSLLLLLLLCISRIKCLLLILIMQPTLEMYRIGGSINGWEICSIIAVLTIIFKKQRIKKHFPFKTIFFFSFVACFISYILGSYNGLTSIVPFLAYFCLSYALWTLYIPIKENLIWIAIICFLYYGALSLYGAYEAFTFTTPYIDWLHSIGLESEAEQGEGFVRFGLYRAQSFTPWCTIFGMTCGIGFVFVANTFLNEFKKIVPSLALLFLLALQLLGVLFSADRTAILMTFIFGLSLIPYLKTKKKWVIVFVLFLVYIYYEFEDYFQAIYFAFTHTEEATGSSVSMRLSQLNAALTIFNDSPIWGHGLSAILKMIETHGNLLGAESIIFRLLINQGIIGIANFIFMLFVATLYFIKTKKLILLPMFWGFMIYSIIALPVSEFYIFAFLIVLIKNLNYLKNTKNENNYSYDLL